jgi:aryl-alcohol dehydrogenase-like predicted oxidoreductase
MDPRCESENFDANQRAAAVGRDFAVGKQVKPGQIALARPLQKVVPIPGAKRRPHLEESVRLDVADMGDTRRGPRACQDRRPPLPGLGD